MRLVENSKIVVGFHARDIDTLPTEDYVSMKNYNHLTVILELGVTGAASTVTLKQASDVAGTGEKALAFTKNWVNLATGTSDALVETTVTSNTFDTDTADSLLYVMEVDADDLDVDNGFDCVRIDVTDPAAATFASCIYILTGPRYAQATPPTAITD